MILGSELAHLVIRDLGRCSYQYAWEIQKDLQRKLIDGVGQETLLLCEHDPVITLGTSAKDQHLLVSQARLEELGVSITKTERGGDITYHGPGQLVAYPLLDLRNKRRDVGWYMRSLEQAVINTLRHFDIEGIQVPGKTGVWTKPTVNAIDFQPRKVASIGVRISRWCTMHGLALNVYRHPEAPDGFSLITPCGLHGVEMSWLEDQLPERSSAKHTGSALMQNVKPVLVQALCEVFGLSSSQS